MEEQVIIKETKIYKFGEILVGLDSEDIEESVEVEIKRKFAEIAELALTNYSTTDKSPVKSLLFDHAIGEILNAQMSVVKVITFKS
ncbi:MAG: hypothetical protein NTY55_02985 [Flavobacteriia bacterium]|jgi:hypothetical protein|nr:hypothetical protein [Flavobacteriia bacterium]